LVAARKPPRFADWDYWARPVPGFGDVNGRLLVIGLAPARTGALRTGRIFTGDASSRFLVTALHSAGFANQPISESRDDGLVYTDCYVTAAVKCAPPGDRPLPGEIENCSSYLEGEIRMLENLKSVLALGSLAFHAYLGYLSCRGVNVRGIKFSHGEAYEFAGAPTLYASFHPSPRNTNTGKLSQRMFVAVLKRIRRDLQGAEPAS
jgi:uracil-DNA glycosylase family 4